MVQYRCIACELATACFWVAFTERANGVVDSAYSLGPSTTVGTVASFELSLHFEPDGGREMGFFSIDVSSSSPALSGSPPDYGRFSFTRASPLLNGWDPIPGTGFGTGPFGAVIEFDTLTDLLPAGDYVLGTLAVDFGSAGIPGGRALTVSVDAFDSVIGVEVPGDPSTFDFVGLAFSPGAQGFVTPGGPGPTPVPEPLTGSLGGLALAALALALGRRPLGRPVAAPLFR